MTHVTDNAPALALLETQGRTARLTLNRPDARNALSLPLLEALHARADELAQMHDVSVCIITGAGKCFCAGMDLKAVLDEPDAPAKLLHSIAELTIKLRALPQVTIARINAAAIGGGCGVACVCDLAISHPEAKLGYPEVDIGVCPAVVAPWLIQRVGAGKAREILLRGGTMDATTAHRLGLITQLVDQSELDNAVNALAARLAAAGPRALTATKVWLNKIDGDQIADEVRQGAQISADVVSTPEAQASLRAFFASR